MDWQERPEATEKEKPSGDLPAVPSPGSTSSFRRIGRRFTGRLYRLDVYHWMLVCSLVVLAVVGVLYWRSREEEEAGVTAPNPAEELLPIVDEVDIDGGGRGLRPPETRPSPTPTDRPEPMGSVPAPEPVESAAGNDRQERPPEPVRIHTVRKGETLWSIAEYYYGNGNEWRKIADANPEINPDLLTPGQQLRIPPR